LSGCGITPSADDSVVLSSGNVGTTLGGTVSKAARRTLTVGTLKLQYSTVGGSALGFQNRLLDVIPVRIS
jgi:glycine cleavage system aminomethyltransferase T